MRPRLTAIPLTVLLAASAIGAPPAPAVAGTDPSIWGELDTDFVGGQGFLPGRPVVVQIFDAPGGSLLQTKTVTADGSGSFGDPDNLVETGGLDPGMYVTATDGISSKALTLVSLTFDTLDPSTDTASGTAPPEVGFRVTGGTDDDPGVPPDTEEFTVITSSGAAGTWLVDFGAAGIDLRAYSYAYAHTEDEDGDGTRTGFRAPAFGADLRTDLVGTGGEGWWDAGSSVAITIYAADGAMLYDARAATDYHGNFAVGYDTHGVDLRPGMRIEVSDGDDSLSHTLSALTWDVLDPVTDTGRGTLPAGVVWLGMEIHFGPGEDDVGKGIRHVNADGDTIWSASFGPDLDITDESWGTVSLPDGTAASYRPPGPALTGLRDIVVLLVRNGELTRMRGATLRAQLTVAAAFVRADRDAAAVAALRGFIRQVERYVRDGHLSPRRGVKLAGDAGAVIASLRSG